MIRYPSYRMFPVRSYVSMSLLRQVGWLAVGYARYAGREGPHSYQTGELVAVVRCLLI
jgi:hypothetical protein